MANWKSEIHILVVRVLITACILISSSFSNSFPHEEALALWLQIEHLSKILIIPIEHLSKILIRLHDVQADLGL